MKLDYGKEELFTCKTWCWIAVVLCICSSIQAEWKPAKGPLMTRWAKDVSPDKVHPEYPRPQMVRKDWLNLNGLWEYAIRLKDEPKPATFDGQILVPFPAESALSGVMRRVGEENRLWYRRTFEIPSEWTGKRILLHFGAVDWQATVWVNGRKVGDHHGGYDPFTFDITEALNNNGSQELIVSVWDPTDAGSQPRGKQVRQPRGIWYTAVTGIWQTVWLEPVPIASIERLEITPDVDSGLLTLIVQARGVNMETHLDDKFGVRVIALDGEKQITESTGHLGSPIRLKIPNPKLWSPDSPFLYDLRITLMRESNNIDQVGSYFGMRKISLAKDKNGVTRLFLNNTTLFMFGPLDQGFWPDGLYSAPADEALRYDIEVLKQLGCNMMRKHVKVEPARLYYWCDKLGLMVWQDMPNGNNKSDADKKQFELELTHVIEALRNHPSIIMWVPFNEGWGQHDTPRLVDLIKRLDPTRLVNNASGWKDAGVGDVHDIHKYPGPATPPTEEARAAVLGEFGGLGLPIKGYTWQDEKNWGYRTYKTREELTDAYVALIENLRPLIGGGLSAAVYTQTTDVEIEVNGLMTYDRAMIKMDADRAAAANRRLYLPPPVIKTVVPTSQTEPQNWRYTTSKPADGWQQADFDDSSWQKGQGGFGTKSTPGAAVRTEWNTSDIWLRRSFEISDKRFSQPQLLIHHDEDAEVYINGCPCGSRGKLEGYTTGYSYAALDEKAVAALRPGSNCLAVHCRQTQGGQYIDVGIVDVVEQPIK